MSLERIVGFSVKSKRTANLIGWFLIVFGVVYLALGVVSLLTRKTLEELWSGNTIVEAYTGSLFQGWKWTFLVGVILGASAILTGILLRRLVKKPDCQ